MKKIIITSETPLSALIREAHHQELATIIEKWRPFLKVDCSNVDVLQLSYFEFDSTCGRFVGTRDDNLSLREYDRSDWSARAPEQQQLAFEAPDPDNDLPF